MILKVFGERREHGMDAADFLTSKGGRGRVIDHGKGFLTV